MTPHPFRRAVLAIAAFAAVAGGSGFLVSKAAVGHAAAAESASTPAPASAPAAPRVALPDFTSIVRSQGPAVVNVSVTGTEKTGFPGGDADPFSQFFRGFGFHPSVPREVPTHGIGSGFIVSPDGVVLTNAHVVDGARQVRVKLTDRREFTARVVGVDKDTDVAVLRIDAKGLPTVKLGDPARTQVGEWVVAIGSPFGFENTVTAGVVSAKARSLPGEGYIPFLQTDVPVNPGNSGGPLFNLAGEVIGINSQIYTRSGGFQGVSFAIPIDVATHVERQLLATGTVVRGRIGVTVQDVDQQLANAFGLPRPGGALVGQVVAGGPGDRAGLRPGDVILKLDGQDVSGSGDLPPRVAMLAPGTKAKLEVWRHGTPREVEVTIGSADGEQEQVAQASSQGHGRLGVSVRPLTPEERRESGLEGGLVVEQASGAAAQAGIQQGDVVLSLNGTPVKTPDQLKSLLARSGKEVALLVQRGDERIFVPVELG